MILKNLYWECFCFIGSDGLKYYLVQRGLSEISKSEKVAWYPVESNPLNIDYNNNDCVRLVVCQDNLYLRRSWWSYCWDLSVSPCIVLKQEGTSWPQFGQLTCTFILNLYLDSFLLICTSFAFRARGIVLPIVLFGQLETTL